MATVTVGLPTTKAVGKERVGRRATGRGLFGMITDALEAYFNRPLYYLEETNPANPSGKDKVMIFGNPCCL